MMLSKLKISVTVILLTFLIVLFLFYKRKTKPDIGLLILKSNDTEYDMKKISNNNLLFNLTFNYFLNNENICKGKRPLAVFIVTSYFGNMETRSAMRRAFPGDELMKLNFVRVFLLGQAPLDKYTHQRSIEDENKKFNDLIQGNFLEAYRNLTYKHIMGHTWVSNFCSNAKYVIKMDDDIVVNIRKLHNLLNNSEIPQSRHILSGYVLKNMKPVREKANKWYVTYEEYPGRVYPTFLSGWLYITVPNVSTKLSVMSHQVKYLWIDDLYVTGILALNLKFKFFDMSQYFTVHSEVLECCLKDMKKFNISCDILVGPNGGDSNMFYDFNVAVDICNKGGCVKRTNPLEETCVVEKKNIFSHGNAIVEKYNL